MAVPGENFKSSDDLNLLVQVLYENSFEHDNWTGVADALNGRGREPKFTPQACQDRTLKLLSEFSKKDRANLQKSGTEEEYDFKISLLTDVNELYKDFCKMKKNVPIEEPEKCLQLEDVIDWENIGANSPIIGVTRIPCYSFSQPPHSSQPPQDLRQPPTQPHSSQPPQDLRQPPTQPHSSQPPQDLRQPPTQPHSSQPPQDLRQPHCSSQLTENAATPLSYSFVPLPNNKRKRYEHLSLDYLADRNKTTEELTREKLILDRRRLDLEEKKFEEEKYLRRLETEMLIKERNYNLEILKEKDETIKKLVMKVLKE